MAELVLSSAMGKLESLELNKVVPLPTGAKKQVKGLWDDLNTTLHILNNSGLCGKKFREGSICDHSMYEVLDMAHDADVAIDIFIFNLEKSRNKGGLLRKKVYDLSHIHQRINTIREKIEKIKEYAERWEFSSTRSPSLQPQIWDPWVDEPTVVGLSKDVEFLLQKAVFNDGENKGVCVSSIVGMGGVGKTTLAKLVYNHERVVLNFPCRAWVDVSSEFSEADVLRELLLRLGVEYNKVKVGGLTNNDLRDMLAECLKGTPYFIVLDDVWRDADLEMFMRVFQHQDNASRLVVTSRTRNIIKDAHYIHEMRILDPNDSWQLFLKTVFVEQAKCPDHLEEIGRKILAKCNGLPLAIVVVGSQLSYLKQLESEWENFLVESMDLRPVSSVLELSYIKLPPKLKSCFLGLVFFKEGATVRVEKLIHLWTTGGMLSQGEVKDETDAIGRKQLDELINQYMLEVRDLSSGDNSRVKICCINSNLHRLAVTKAEEEIRFEVLRNDGASLSPHIPRHGVINCSREKFTYSTNQLKHLVSLFLRGGLHFDVDPSYWKSFELLKRLDFEGFGLKTLSEMVGKLVFLEYLGLRNNYLRDLPQSLCSLERIEVLDIAQNFMVKLPDIIRKMGSLRHLYMSDIICWKPLMIDSLMNLQTLTYITVDSWIYELSGLEVMHSLRKLGIEEFDGTSDVSKIFASLVKLENLECLILRGSRFKSLPSLNELGVLNRLTQLKLDGVLPRLTSPNCFPPMIRYLTLANSSLDEDPMPVLENLSELGFVKLRNAFTGEQMVVSKLGFAKLRVLCIGELWSLKSLQVGEGAMPKLERVEIQNCPRLKVLPQEIVFTKCIARKK